MNEFSLIQKYFAPLARVYDGSLQLTDDAALLDVPEGKQLVITKDAISAGVHFIGNEDAALIAKKLLRVNLSDLAAMGATPLCYFLAIMLPKNIEEVWIARFAEGLAEDQRRYDIHLAGGDTISTHGALSFSITAVGIVEKGRALTRSSAQLGDKIYVSGSIGDSALGLQAITSSWQEAKYLVERYLLPEPRLALGQRLMGIVNACMDISDGLVQDLEHICRASGLGADLYRDRIPISAPARTLIEKDPALWNKITGGGDDYELLFTVTSDKESTLTIIANELQLPLTCIGKMRAGEGVTVLDANKTPLAVAKGFSHF